MKKRIKCYVGTNSLRNSKGIYVLEVNIQTGFLSTNLEETLGILQGPAGDQCLPLSQLSDRYKKLHPSARISMAMCSFSSSIQAFSISGYSLDCNIPSVSSKFVLKKYKDKILLIHNAVQGEGMQSRTGLSIWVSEDNMQSWNRRYPLVKKDMQNYPLLQKKLSLILPFGYSPPEHRSFMRRF